MRLAWLVLAFALPCLATELSPETQFSLLSLREGERARLEAAVGDVGAMPLVRAELDVAPDKRKVTGSVSLRLVAKRRTTSVYLRLVPNANHPGAVQLLSALVNGQKAAVARPDPSLLQLAVEPPVEKGGTVEVALKVAGTLPELPEGSDSLSASTGGRGGDYGAFSASADVLGLSGVLPMVPPEKADGTVAEGPSGIGDLGTFEPTNFVVSVAVPAGWQAVGAGHVLGEVPDGAGKRRFAWALSGAREFPVLVVKGYEVATKQVNGITVESHYLARDAKSGKAALEHAAKALELLEAKVGPYPYRTFRVVEARFVGGAGGMEFPGLVTVSAALYRGAVDPMAALGMPELADNPLIKQMLAPMLGPMLKDALEFTVNHEVAHQYFAMLVGNDPVAEPVADEPLTQHVALLLLEWRKGKKAADLVRENQVKLAFQVHRLMGGADGVANRPTHEFESNTEYAALVYGKAPLLFDAQRKLVGDAAWERALRTYVAEHRYKWVTASTFTELVAKQSGNGKVKALQQRWWEEKHGDEDVGGLNLDDLFSTDPAAGGTQLPVDPALAKQLEELLRQLSGE
ncbi:MAG: M1 family aminopeptidase [Myxococcota bacterium]